MKIEDLVTFEVNGKKCVAFVRKLTEREHGSRPLPQGGRKQSDRRDILNTRDWSY